LFWYGYGTKGARGWVYQIRRTQFLSHFGHLARLTPSAPLPVGVTPPLVPAVGATSYSTLVLGAPIPAWSRRQRTRSIRRYHRPGLTIPRAHQKPGYQLHSHLHPRSCNQDHAPEFEHILEGILPWHDQQFVFKLYGREGRRLVATRIRKSETAG